MDTLTSLRVFRQVAENGSFTAAARILHVSQPGVTRQVQRFEQELGVSLLERGGSRCRLTPDRLRHTRDRE